MKLDKKLSIFIPFYNEEKNLSNTVTLVERVAQKQLDEFEILLVNDGSTDRSGEIAFSLQNKNIRFLSMEKNSGFGMAYLRGYKESRHPFALYLCADGDVTENELEELFKNWDGQSNQIQYCLNKKLRNKWRFILSELYIKFLVLLTQKKMNYFNGFNILSTRNKEQLVIRDFGFSSQAYLLLHALNNGHETRQFGMLCKFNDSQSKSINIKSILKTLHFFFYLMGKN